MLCKVLLKTQVSARNDLHAYHLKEQLQYFYYLRQSYKIQIFWVVLPAHYHPPLKLQD